MRARDHHIGRHWSVSHVAPRKANQNARSSTAPDPIDVSRPSSASRAQSVGVRADVITELRITEPAAIHVVAIFVLFGPDNHERGMPCRTNDWLCQGMKL